VRWAGAAPFQALPGTTFDVPHQLDIWFSSAHACESAILRCDSVRTGPETELATDQGIPVSKGGDAKPPV
jgi:hypothetical protein